MSPVVVSALKVSSVWAKDLIFSMASSFDFVFLETAAYFSLFCLQLSRGCCEPMLVLSVLEDCYLGLGIESGVDGAKE